MTLGPWYVGDTPTTNIVIKVLRDGELVQLDPYASAQVLLYGPTGDSVVWGTNPTINPATDEISVTPPTTSPFTASGIFNMYLRLTDSASRSETFFATDVRVLKLGAAAGWATTSNVRSITGESVTEDELADAQNVIELYAGRTFAGSQANDSIRPKDKVWLQKAVAYQAVWQRTQPGYKARHAIKEVNQDGAQVIYAGSSEPNNTALVMLGPLAQRSLKNVSWLRSRTIKIKPQSHRAHESYGDYKRNDDHPGWGPM